jgi:alginate O-acetyltransferase complex protein AlgI
VVFSSPTFLFAFLPIVLVATWVCPARFRRFVLLAASAVFYAWGVQGVLAIVWASALLDWALALGIRKAKSTNNSRRANLLLVIGIVQNLAILGYYKYLGFADEQLEHLASLLGANGPGIAHVALPIGVSFFTFEKISYVVDVWRGDVEPRRDPTDVLLFVSLFPRSIAGPIVRLREIQQDIHMPRPRAQDASDGAIRFAHGLAKKVLVADQLAPIADSAFATASTGNGTGLTTSAAWLGALAYSLQLYYDFSGYSDMAIGIGRMLGFRLPENFDRPYSSHSITEFWRRWHMTLSRWFRDYVYISLGGNHGGRNATYRNLIIVFALTGLWHGAAWSFVLWGLYHGVWLLVERAAGWRTVGDEPVRRPALRRATTFLIVLIGWVLFRAGSLSTALDYYRAMIAFRGGMTGAVHTALNHQATFVLVVAAVIVVLPGRRSAGRWLTEAVGRIPDAARTASLALGAPIAMVYVMSTGFHPFLYFQF